MTIDASIPLRAGQVMSLSEIMDRVERVKTMQANRERSQWDLQQAKAEAERKTKARNTLADLILADPNGAPGYVATPQPGLANMAPPAGSGAPASAAGRGLPVAEAERRANAYPTAGSMPVPTNPDRPILDPAAIIPQGPVRPNPWADYVHADPNAAMDYRAATTKWDSQRFDHAQELNEAGLQILGAVYDQPSYDRAKNVARVLYSKFGMNLDDMQLPDEYSPELIDALRNEAISAKDQLAAARLDRKQAWDMEDDQLDNARADRNTDSLIDNRQGRLGEYQRHNRTSEGNMRRGQDMRDATQRRGQDKRPASSGRGSGYAKPTATDAKGNKVEWNGKAWVPVK